MYGGTMNRFAPIRRSSLLIFCFLMSGFSPGSSSLNEALPHAVCLTGESTAKTSIGLHRFYGEFRLAAGQVYESSGSMDVGDIVVLEASTQNGILVPKNHFDLNSRSVEFIREDDGSYDVKVFAEELDQSASTFELEIPYNTSSTLDLGFNYSFFRKNYGKVRINSDGSLTFRRSSKVSPSAAGLDADLFGRLPRIAPLFSPFMFYPVAKVSVSQKQDRITVTWRNTDLTQAAQATLFQTGNIKFNYSGLPRATFGLTGIASGKLREIPHFVDFTKSGPLQGIQGTIAEVFQPGNGLDQASIARNFLANHPDVFDMLIVFPGSKVFPRGECTGCGVAYIYKNDIRGIGRSRYDYTKFFVKSRRFRQMTLQIGLEDYPVNPHEVISTFPVESNWSPLALVAHEVGHQWSSSVEIVENGIKTKNLLRDAAHWSFFTDTDGSYLGGNEIQDNGNGSFTTLAASQGYSPLEQYLMGLRSSASVPPFFYVANATGAYPTDTPVSGIDLFGQRTDVTIEQVIDAEGPRIPDSTQSQHVFNLAFILIVPEGTKPVPSDLKKIERIRSEFPGFFRLAVEDRGRVNTSLNPQSQL